MRKIKRKSRRIIFYFAFLIFVGVSIGYAALTTSLNITGQSTLSKNLWDVHFEDVRVLNNYTADQSSRPTIDSTQTKITFSLKLTTPGQFYEISTDVVNSGTIDAMLSTISNNLTTSQKKYLEYSVKYIDGASMNTKDYLKKGTKQRIKIKIYFKKDITAADLQATTSSISIAINLKYLQADSTAHERTKASIVCKRATVLETATCSRTSSGCYAAGYYNGGSKGTTTITYGNLGTSGILSSGDAFDCDVKGTGTTNRFYYLTDLDSTTAILLSSTFSYKNFSTLGNQAPYVCYDCRYIPDFKTAYGPLSARLMLPTTGEWANVTLKKPIRAIESKENDIIHVNIFNYSEYAARLPSTSEISNCGSLSSDSCIFLYQHTAYENSNYPVEEILTETPYGVELPYVINTSNRQYQPYPYGAVKAAIELPKTRISY